MKRTVPWDTLAAMPVGGTTIVCHEHESRRTSVSGHDLKCVRHQTIIANAKAHGLSLHVFHDDRKRLWVVRTA